MTVERHALKVMKFKGKYFVTVKGKFQFCRAQWQQWTSLTPYIRVTCHSFLALDILLSGIQQYSVNLLFNIIFERSQVKQLNRYIRCW